MQINLGNEPQELTVTLARDAEFVAALQSNEAWPVGIAIELQFRRSLKSGSPITWPATISGDLASWTVSETDCAAVVDEGMTLARLIYVDEGGNDILWAKGRVIAV